MMMIVACMRWLSRRDDAVRARSKILAILVGTLCLCLSGSSRAATGELAASVEDPGPNEATEAVRPDYSLDKAIEFLDAASLHWQKQRKCFTCHTNLAYLYARSQVRPDGAAVMEVRASANELVEKRWPTKGPRWDAEVVAMAAALAHYDAHMDNALSKQARMALDRMWTLQRADGGWDWLKCEWPPFEYDDHYGATLAAIAVGSAPDDYRESAEAVKGMQSLRGYFENNPPENEHHRAMLLWAGSYHPQLVSEAQKSDWISTLLKLQRPDGGWAVASLGEWQRSDESPQDKETSDGYGTGFVLVALHHAGVEADHPQVQRGVAWLRSNQRESGRWFTRSLYRDGNHFLSHAGTAFAVMALEANNAAAANAR